MLLLFKKLIKKILASRKNVKNKLLNHLVKDSGGLTLLDIGAAGEIQPRWEPIAKQLEYIGVEPDERTSSKLLNDLKCKSYQIINSVAWSKKDHVEFYLTNKPQLSSAFIPDENFINKFPYPERFKIQSTITIETSTLDDVITDQEIDFIKLDIQGAEIDALKGLEKNLEKCLGLELEVEFSSIYKDQPLFGAVDQHLKHKGFEFIDFTNICRWERKNLNSYGQAVFGDGLWLRTPEYITSENKQKALKYISICTLYGRLDLAYRTLELLELKPSKKYLNNLKTLKQIQNNVRKIHLFSNRLLRLSSHDDLTRSHLIY